MAKILLRLPEGPYRAIIDTEVMDIEIHEAFLGVKFVSPIGKTLSVSMRDGGFELIEGQQ